MILAVAAIARTTAGSVATPDNPRPDPIDFIQLGADRVDWTGYTVPGDFAGYEVRYTTTAGQTWANSIDLAPGLQIQSYALLSTFPANAVECLVAPVDAAGQYGLPEARQALKATALPPPITSITLQSDRVAWTYTPPTGFAGYDVRYTTVAGGQWATATKLYPALQPATHAYALKADFPAAAVECLVAPVNTAGGIGLPEARQGGLQVAINQYALGPAAAYTANWTPQPGDTTVLVTNEAAGIVVDCTRNGTPPDASTTAFLTLWAKSPLPAGRDWTFKSRWTQLDTNPATQSDGIFLQIQTVTGGLNGSDINPNNWTTAQYQDAALTYRSTTGAYDKYSTGWRFSFDQDAPITTNNDQLRGHSFTGGVETQLDPTGSYAATFPFVPNVIYDLTVQWRSATSTLTWTLARADGTGTPVVVPATDAGIGSLMGTYLGLNVSPGRKVRIENISLTDDGPGGGVPPPPPPPSGEAWRDDTTQWAQILPLAQVSAANIVHINSNADLPLMNPGVPGKHYVIGANITGTVTVSGKGTLGSPIVIRGDYDGTDRTQFRKWTWTSGTNLTVNGASHIYVTKIAFVGGAANQSGVQNVNVTGAATRISIERCWSYGHTSSNLYGTCPYGINASANVRFYRLRYCEHGHPTIQTPAGMWDIGTPSTQTNYPTNIYIYRNLISNINANGVTTQYGTVLLSIGRGAQSSDIDNKTAIYENRVRDMIDFLGGEGFEMKCAGVFMCYNTLECNQPNGGKGHGNAVTLRIRNGQRGTMIGNLFVHPTGGGQTGALEFRGGNSVCINNWSVALNSTAQVTASSPAGQASVRVNGGNVDGLISYSIAQNDVNNATYSPRPNAGATLVGGNHMQVIVGNDSDNDSYGGALQLLNSPINVVGPVAASSSVAYRNRTVTIGNAGDKDYAGRGKSRKSYTGPPAYGTPISGSGMITNQAIAGANYDKVPVRLFDADVGVACKVYA